MNTAPNPRLPALFLGHGSPMNALENNRFTQSWARLAASIPKPDHYLSLLYVLGARRSDDVVRFEMPQVTCGSLSMLSVVVGA